MRIEHAKLRADLAALRIELRSGSSLAELTSLGIGGTTDLLRITRHESIPELIALLERHDIGYKFLGGGALSVQERSSNATISATNFLVEAPISSSETANCPG